MIAPRSSHAIAHARDMRTLVPTRTLVAALLFGLGTLSMTSCGGGDDMPTGPSGDGAISISPGTATVAISETVTLSATRDGAAIDPTAVFWSSADPAIASVSAQGVVTAVSIGTVKVAASSQGRSAQATVTVAPRRVARVEIAPATSSLVPGDTTMYQVSAFASNGEPLTGRSATVTSGTPTVIAVIDGSRLVALAPGTARITAVVDGVSATVDIFVRAAAVATVELIPDSLNVAIGTTARLVAVTRDRNGIVLPGRPVTFSSSAPAVATVAPDGTVRGMAPGRAEVTAVSEAGAAIAVIIVPAPTARRVVISPAAATLLVDEAVRLTATVRDAADEVIEGRTFTWSSSAPSVATVDVTGRVRAIRPGAAIITATSGDVSAGAAITVVRAPLARIDLTPSTVALAVGETRQLTATARDSRDEPIPDVNFQWTSSASGVAIVSSTGGVTALGAGTATVTASAGGVSAQATITVSPAPVESVRLTPTSMSLRVGSSASFTATPLDAAGVPVSGASVTWSSSDPTVATVNTVGVVTAISVGSSTITATSGGKSNTATVTVNRAAVASLSIEPTSVALAVGGTRKLVATALDGEGNRLPDAVVAWSSSAPSIVEVSSDGTVTALAVGAAAVIATSEGVSAGSSVTVARLAVATIDLDPTSLSLTVGKSARVTPTARDANGTAIADAVIEWSSDAPAVATVSNTGVVSAVGPGSATITAASEGATATLPVTVTPPAVARVDVAPPTLELLTGESSQLTATAFDADDVVIADATISWSSSNDAVASVTADGMVQGNTAGTATITATSGGISGSSIVTITAPPPAVPRIVVVSGDGQQGPRGEPLAEKLVIRVTNAAGDPIPLVPVTWEASNGGTITPDGLFTDSDGRVTATWRLGNPPGKQQARANALLVGVVTFSATAVTP